MTATRTFTVPTITFTSGCLPDCDRCSGRYGHHRTPPTRHTMQVASLDQHESWLAELVEEGREPSIGQRELRLHVGQDVNVHAYGRMRLGVVTGFGRTRVTVRFARNAQGDQDTRAFVAYEVHLPDDVVPTAV